MELKSNKKLKRMSVWSSLCFASKLLSVKSGVGIQLSTLLKRTSTPSECFCCRENAMHFKSQLMWKSQHKRMHISVLSYEYYNTPSRISRWQTLSFSYSNCVGYTIKCERCEGNCERWNENIWICRNQDMKGKYNKRRMRKTHTNAHKSCVRTLSFSKFALDLQNRSGW